MNENRQSAVYGSYLAKLLLKLNINLLGIIQIIAKPFRQYRAWSERREGTKLSEQQLYKESLEESTSLSYSKKRQVLDLDSNQQCDWFDIETISSSLILSQRLSNAGTILWCGALYQQGSRQLLTWAIAAFAGEFHQRRRNCLLKALAVK